MKYIKSVLFILVISLLFMTSVYANTNKNLVNIYLFYSEGCPHCEKEKKLLNELKDKYDNIRIYKYEVSNDKNMDLYLKVSDLYDVSVTGVPCTFIGDKVYKGFSVDESKIKFSATIEYYSNYGYRDIVGEYIGGIELPNYEIDNGVDIDEFIDNYGNYVISFFGINIETKNLTLPFIAILIGFIDGFNLWVLLLFISILIGIKNKQKMWVLGFTFLFVSYLFCLFFMLFGLNIDNLLMFVTFIRLLVGIMGIVLGSLSLFRCFKGNEIVIDGKRNIKIFDKIRKFILERNFFLLICGAVILSIFVKVIELSYSSELSVIFMEILSINNLTIIEEILYISLYMLFFLIDDLVIFLIFMRVMEITNFSIKYGKLFKLVSGIILFLIGILVIFKL